MSYLSDSFSLETLYKERFKACLQSDSLKMSERFGSLAPFLIEGLINDASDIHLSVTPGSDIMRGSMRALGFIKEFPMEIPRDQGLESIVMIAGLPLNNRNRLLSVPSDFSVNFQFGECDEFLVRVRGVSIPLKGDGVKICLRFLYAEPSLSQFKASIERSEFKKELLNPSRSTRSSAKKSL